MAGQTEGKGKRLNDPFMTKERLTATGDIHSRLKGLDSGLESEAVGNQRLEVDQTRLHETNGLKG